MVVVADGDGPAQAWQSVEAGTAALRSVQPQIREGSLPPGPPGAVTGYLTDPFTLTAAATGNSPLRRRYEQPLVTTLAVVGLVLLIACANIANLLLARATARRHEWSVRRALGAPRWRLARQLLAESLILAGAGAALGVVLARWSSQILVRQLSTQTNTVFLDLAVDWRVLGFTSAVTIGTALLFGMTPAFRASGAAPMEAIKEQGRGSVGGSRISLASGLVVAQVALSLVLVVAAGLFMRTFSSLANVRLGFDRDRVLLVNINAQRTSIPPADRLPTWERLRQSVLAVPGVASAAVSFMTPVTGGVWNNRVDVSGGVEMPERHKMSNFNAVTPGWFTTFGTPILAGRDFNEGDRKNAPPVILVNQAFAKKFLNGANPIGHTVTIGVGGGDQSTPKEVVGLVADAVYRAA
jgi:putative ABC transport system permease protein